MIQIACCAVLVGMTSVMIALAQSPDEVRPGERVTTAVRTAETIRLDGRLDESAWQQARPIVRHVTALLDDLQKRRK